MLITVPVFVIRLGPWFSQTLGSGAMTNPIADITEDVDMILLVGSNPEEAHPVIGAQIRQAIQRGTQVVVVDPRKLT